jgi:hypothetical protein
LGPITRSPFCLAISVIRCSRSVPSRVPISLKPDAKMWMWRAPMCAHSSRTEGTSFAFTARITSPGTSGRDERLG